MGTTNDERREVARRLRKTIGLTEFAEALGFNWTDDSDWGWKDVSNLVADLIEPTDGFDLDHMAQVCYERLEGCDEPEYTLYETILTAISRYKRGESGLPSAALVDRDALLALADECDSVHMHKVAHRIREALGVYDHAC